MTIYDIFFFGFSLAYLPYLVIKGKAHKDFLQRFGNLPPSFREIGASRPVWVHAVSVGEVMAAKNFIEKLSEKYPEKRIVLSTTTRTGQEVAEKTLNKSVLKFYFPVDFSFVIKRVAKLINPSVLLIMETELWPNLILEISKRQIPIALLNGRISERSFKGYKRIKPFFGNILQKINLFCMRSRKEAERIEAMGARKERVKVTGNMKFDTENMPDRLGQPERSTGAVDTSWVFIAGSTHNGEEEIIIDIYTGLLKEFKNLKLLIAPRHVDKAQAIKNLAAEKSFEAVLWSGSKKDFSEQRNGKTVFILDTFGELGALYGIASVVFMGGSLIKRGGHNLVEPAFFGKPVIFGPHMFNFKDMARSFLDNDAALQIKDKEELLTALGDLLRDGDKRNRLGSNARELIEKSKGATERNIREVEKLF